MFLDFFVCKYNRCQVFYIVKNTYIKHPLLNWIFNMKKNLKHDILYIPFYVFAFMIFFFSITSCKNNASSQTQPPVNDAGIRTIENVAHFNKIIETSEERLLILDFYADWCPPCKELEPILEKIAKEEGETISIYKIDVDRNRELSNSFRITGIPHVAFVKNKETVFSLTGLYPKNMYLKVIEQYTQENES